MWFRGLVATPIEWQNIIDKRTCCTEKCVDDIVAGCTKTWMEIFGLKLNC